MVLAAVALALAGCGSDARSTPAFDLQRIDADGRPLPGGIVYAETPWACVLDRASGLTWEVKKPGPGLRAAANTYRWSDRAAPPDGSPPAASCPAGGCTAKAYVAAVNRIGLCGFTDWRLPERSELASLNDPRRRFPGPTTPTAYFPNARAGGYWSATTYRFKGTAAWLWDYHYGLDRVDWKWAAYHLRLVRGAYRPHKLDR